MLPVLCILLVLGPGMNAMADGMIRFNVGLGISGYDTMSMDSRGRCFLLRYRSHPDRKTTESFEYPIGPNRAGKIREILQQSQYQKVLQNAAPPVPDAGHFTIQEDDGRSYMFAERSIPKELESVIHVLSELIQEIRLNGKKLP